MKHYLDTAEHAARAAGKLLRENFRQRQRVNAVAAHDVKLEIDVQTQELITNLLLKEFPGHALYGEEGFAGDQNTEHQWVVDPLDGTVNYFYGIPHFCVSIALRLRSEILVGVIYDPMRDEMWAGQKGDTPKLNGQPFHVSDRAELAEAVISIGLAKTGETINANFPLLQAMIHRVRKCRVLGSAALDMAYVACGRFDAYIETGISLWDIAAGWLLIENAGGTVDLRPLEHMKEKYSIVASNGIIDLKLS
jgi:myo-inositol-1(or 4)-monophosphatase